MKIIGIQTVNEPDVPRSVMRLNYRSAVDEADDWAWVWPPESGRTWVVSIHGHGSHGDQLYRRADLRYRLNDFRSAGWGILTPNLRGNSWMCPKSVADLHALLAEIRTRYQAQTFVFFGGSMGGTSNLIYATQHPEDVRALAAFCSASDLAGYYQWCRQQPPNRMAHEIADAIRNAYGGAPDAKHELYRQYSARQQAARLTMPIFLAHGADDALIPVTESRKLAEAMRGKPGFIYREVPQGVHDLPASICVEGTIWLRAQLTA